MTGIEYFYNDLWAKAKNLLKEDSSIGKLVYETYFEESNLVFLNEEKAIIAVPTNLQKMILSQKLHLFGTILGSILNHSVNCEVHLENDITSQSMNSSKEEEYVIEDDHVMPEYTFDNFIVGPSNKEAHSASLACAYTPGKFYTPLFIYGNSGLGKTHLLNSIGNYIKQNEPSKNVFYTSSTDF
jgi:chromosomal replication initiator protein